MFMIYEKMMLNINSKNNIIDFSYIKLLTNTYFI